MINKENFLYEAQRQMQLLGYPISDPLLLDAQIHRFGKDKDLWYIGGPSWLVAGDWREQLQRLELTAYGYIISAEERAEIAAKMEAARVEREQDQKKATDIASTWFIKASKNGVSQYLQAKQIKAYDISYGYSEHYKCHFIATPLRDKTGQVWSWQRIYDRKACHGGKANKSFLKEGRKRGCFFILGDIAKRAVIIFCEGYATGASIHQATGYPVVICFDAGNLGPVIAEWRSDYPLHTFLIAGDDARWKKEASNDNA